MAKIKLGAIVVDMRGKLGGHVFAKNRGGNYMRTKTTPVNPQTESQSNVRAMFANVAQGWSQLTEAGRISFNDLVSAYAKTNVFGDIKNPSGKALYQRLNQNLSLSEQSLITECVNPTNAPAQVLSNAEISTATSAITLYMDGDATGSKVLIFATPALSAGTSFVKNKLRLIDVIQGVDPSELIITPEYTAKFGAMAPNGNVYFAFKTINANGQASPMQTVKVVTVA